MASQSTPAYQRLFAVNWRGLLIGAVTLSVGLLVLAMLSREEAGKNQLRVPGTTDDTLARSDYYMEGVVSRHFDQHGHLSHVLSAPRIDHFLAEKRSRMQQPAISLIRADGTPYELHAALADAEHGTETVRLQQDVTLSRAGQGAVAPLRMETEQLQIDLRARSAETPGPVRFVSSTGTVSATGLRANLVTEQIELLAKVQAHYEQPTP